MTAFTQKFFYPLQVFSIVLAFSTVTNTTPAHAQPDNLAPNSGFDNVGNCIGDWDRDCPDSYRAWQSDGDAVFVGTTVHSAGNRRLSLTLSDTQSGNNQTQGAVWIKIPNTNPGEVYEFSAWVKAEDLRGRSLIHASGRSSRNPRQGPIALQLKFGPSGHSGWIKLAFLATVAAGADSMLFALAAQTSRSLCTNAPCGSVHYDNVVVRRLAADDQRSWIPPRTNVCSEGAFLDLNAEVCRNLDKSFGYQYQSTGPASRWLPCSAMTDQRINAEIRALSETGGTLALAPCRVELQDDIVLASNVTLRGSGSGRTILVRDPDWNNTSGTLLRVQGSQQSPIRNVTVRDLTIRGSAPVLSQINNIQIGYADNVLIERVESIGAGKSGIHFWSSQNVTIRYVVSHGSVQWHGIGTKDCYIDPDLDGDDPDQLVSKSECDGGFDRFWTEDIALYSNHTFNNGDFGIDSHASYAEIAGNIMDNNGAASKFPEPAHDVWIHHNDFTNSQRHGTKIANQLSLADDTMTPYRQVLYNNRFANNGSYGIRVHDRAWDVVLLGNSYVANGVSNRMRIVPGDRADARVYSCPGDNSTNDGIDGYDSSHVRLPSNDDRCDLSRVGDIFDR